MSEQQDTLMLMAGGHQPNLANAVAAELRIPLTTAEIGAFFDGETRVHVPPEVAGQDLFLLQSTSSPVNVNLMALVQLIDAARAAGATRVTAVVPYFGYARQDRRSRIGEARSAQIVARMLESVGLDHLVVVDLHSPALESAFRTPATLLDTEELFLPLVRRWSNNDLVIVSPDAGGLKRAQRFAAALDAGLATIAKERPRPDEASVARLLGNVKDCDCVIVDDMASTGRTLVGAAKALRQLGAREVHAVFTHAVMAPGAWDQILAAPLSHIATTDTVSIVPHQRLEIVSVAGLLASTIRSLHEGPGRSIASPANVSRAAATSDRHVPSASPETQYASH